MCKKAATTTPSQPPSNPPESPQKPHWSFAHLIIILLSFVIGYIARDFPTVINGYMKAYGYWGEQDSAGIASNPKVVDFPESFTRDYEKMERELKVYIYWDRDPGACFKSPSTACVASNSKEFNFQESFTLDYERMEGELKIYISRDRDPGAYFQSPRELTGMCGSEAYFFKNIKESRFDPLQARLFFISISWMRIQRTPYENMTVIYDIWIVYIVEIEANFKVYTPIGTKLRGLTTSNGTHLQSDLMHSTWSSTIFGCGFNLSFLFLI